MIRKASAFQFNQYIPLLVVILILMVAALAGMQVTNLPIKLLVAGIAGMLFLLLAVRSIPIALTLLLAVSGTIGLTLGTGTATPLPMVMIMIPALTAVWLVQMLVVDKKVILAQSPLTKPLLGFLLVALVSWMISYVAWDWKITVVKDNLFFVQAGQFAIFACTVAAVLLPSNFSLTERQLRIWTGILIAIWVVATVFQVATGSYSLRENGVTGSLLLWPLVLLWAQLLFNKELHLWLRLAGWLSLPLWMYWIYRFSLNWKGGWLPALFALLFLLWFKSKRLFLVIILIVVLIGLFNLETLTSRVYEVEVQSGSMIRPLYWWDVIRLTAPSPLIGLGPANYEYYWSDPTFIPLSRIAAGWSRWDYWGYSPPSHNVLVDVFAQTGLLGVSFFLWAVIAGLVMAYRLAKQLQPGFLYAYTTAILCGFFSLIISSTVFADWLLPYVYNVTITGFSHSVYSWLLLGTLVPYYNHLSKNERPDPTQA